MTEVAPGEAFDHYELLDVIARGGMATIFRAKDCGDQRIIVLKVLSSVP